jgi:hypothetical protein
LITRMYDHLYQTVKYRVCKAPVGIDTDNCESFIDVFNFFYGLILSFLENCIFNCRGHFSRICAEKLRNSCSVMFEGNSALNGCFWA